MLSQTLAQSKSGTSPAIEPEPCQALLLVSCVNCAAVRAGRSRLEAGADELATGQRLATAGWPPSR
jgi:hypothetical protein